MPHCKQNLMNSIRTFYFIQLLSQGEKCSAKGATLDHLLTLSSMSSFLYYRIKICFTNYTKDNNRQLQFQKKKLNNND